MTEESGARRAATASYMEEMLGEFATMAKSIDCDFLVFLLEMAQQEARNVVGDDPTPGRPKARKGQGRGDRDKLTAEELAALFPRRSSGKH